MEAAINNKIRELRKEKQMTQVRLSIELEVSQGADVSPEQTRSPMTKNAFGKMAIAG